MAFRQLDPLGPGEDRARLHAGDGGKDDIHRILIALVIIEGIENAHHVPVQGIQGLYGTVLIFHGHIDDRHGTAGERIAACQCMNGILQHEAVPHGHHRLFLAALPAAFDKGLHPWIEGIAVEHFVPFEVNIAAPIYRITHLLQCIIFQKKNEPVLPIEEESHRLVSEHIHQTNAVHDHLFQRPFRCIDAFAQLFFKLLNAHGFPIEIALNVLAARLPQEIYLLLRFRPFCQGMDGQVLCHKDNGPDDLTAFFVEIPQESHVDF